MSKIFKLGVIGNPIEHSLSPFIHSRFSRNENINIEYLPYKVADENFDSFIKEFFLDKNSKGLNVTLPHKKKYINAVNTISSSKKGLLLFSTDGIGFIDDMNNKKFKFKNKKILMIGAGAAIESILYKVAQSGASHITVLNRTMEKASRLVRKFSNMITIDTDLNEEIPYDLVINGTSAGLTGEFKPIEDMLIHESTHFYDLNYSLAETPFCKWAKGKSDYVDDGIGMLVYQAAHSFEKWFEVFPETESVIADLYGMRE